MSAAKISGVSYTCPVCSERVHTPLQDRAARPFCYRFRFPYPESMCCHFGEEIEYPGADGLFRLAVEAHTHEEASS